MNLFGHMSLAGGRVASALFALDNKASEWVVGLLIGLFSLLPMLTAIKIGRIKDITGPWPIMLAGVCFLLLGGLIPVVHLSIPTLFASVVFLGFGFSLLSVAGQHTIAEFSGGDSQKRVAYLGWYTLGHSASAVISPILVGYYIDHVSYRAAYVALFITSLLAFSLLLVNSKKLRAYPKPLPVVHSSKHPPGIRSLLATKALKRIYGIGVLLVFLIPILGKRLDFSAVTIGTILSTFAVGTFVVRSFIPWLSTRYNEWQILRVSIAVVVLVYLLTPLANTPWQLMILGFALGSAVGCTQPNMLSLLHSVAPPGRGGEAVGLRMTIGSTSSVMVPLVFGLSASSLGVLPVFWVIALVMAGVWPQANKAAADQKT
jgi:MFS family permease